MNSEGQKDAPSQAPRKHPLTKLAREMQRNKYEPSPQERLALQMCSEELDMCGFKGAATMSILTFALTMGMGWKLKVFQHVLLTAGTAALGAELGCRYSANSCMRRILSLEDSPMRGELISIMRANFPDHPMLKMSRGLHEDAFATISRDPDTYGGEGLDAVVSQPSLLKVGDISPKSGDWSTMLGRGERDIAGSIPGRPQSLLNGSRHDDGRKDFGGADILTDPFDLLLQTGPLEGLGDKRAEGRPETRRSRMSIKERRDHDRQLYAQRREQRQL